MISISFYNSNINPLLVEYQKRVFDHFEIPHQQILHDKSHGEAIDEWLKSNKWDKVAIFDIDCIPLNKYVIGIAYRILQDCKSIYGIAQSANHLDNVIYIGAPFICFSRDVYEEIGMPSFKETNIDDVAGQVTREAIKYGKKLSPIFPANCEEPKWQLGDSGITFGYGTTYFNHHLKRDEIYHAFESRFNHESTSRFINKCKEILNED